MEYPRKLALDRSQVFGGNRILLIRRNMGRDHPAIAEGSARSIGKSANADQRNRQRNPTEVVLGGGLLIGQRQSALVGSLRVLLIGLVLAILGGISIESRAGFLHLVEIAEGPESAQDQANDGGRPAPLLQAECNGSEDQGDRDRGAPLHGRNHRRARGTQKQSTQNIGHDQEHSCPYSLGGGLARTVVIDDV